LDEYTENKAATIAAWQAGYVSVGARPSLENARVSFRMRPDGLTIREIRVRLETRKADAGANAPVAPEQPL
jgi:hypothetical protein